LIPDFMATSGTLTFAVGETSKTITVSVIGDVYAEADETFTVKLSGATNATIPADTAGVLADTGTGTIQNGSDSIVALVVNDASPVVGGDSGSAKTATFHIELSKAPTTALTFIATTRNGTAVKGSDYVELVSATDGVTPGKTFTIPAGSTSFDVPVSIVGDGVFESTESFFLEISNPSTGLAVVQGEARGTILNDDVLVVDSKTVRYIDEDGDLATMKISKGTLLINGVLNAAVATAANPNPQAMLVFSEANAVGGRILKLVDFTLNPVAFSEVSLSITAEPQTGFAASGLTSNGRVDVGFIRGAIVDPVTLQFVRGIDFGNITVEGDVGKITAGDVQVTPSIRGRISVYSLGVRGAATLLSSEINEDTGKPDLLSSFLSVVNGLNVTTDMTSGMRVIGGEFGDINSLTIGGALRGSTNAADVNSGVIFFTGTLAKAKLGSIIGGSSEGSGAITGSTDLGATIGSVRVLGDIVGGSGTVSGRVLAARISSVQVDGDIIGGIGSTDVNGNPKGTDSGEIRATAFLSSVKVLGDVKGGSAARSGLISSNGTLGTVRIDGSLIGGSADDSGAVFANRSVTSMAIHGNIQGGSGERSGSVQAGGSILNLTLGLAGSSAGNLLGGIGENSGTITAGVNLSSGDFVTTSGTIANALIYGSIHGGGGDGTGGVQAGREITKLDVRGNLIGGDELENIATGVERTGYVAAGRIAQMILGGNLQAGVDVDPATGGGLGDSGSIRAQKDIASLVIRGSVLGNANVPAIISAGSNGGTATLPTPAIGTLTITGNTSYLDVLAGYSGSGTPTAQLGTPSNPDVQIGTVTIKGNVLATNIVAGAEAIDGRFGNLDDVVIAPAAPVVDKPSVIASIAKVIIGGTVQTNDDYYGIVAQRVVSVIVAGTAVELNPGAENDFGVEITDEGNSKMQVDEVDL
jgi:hypothetical protein